MKSASGSKERLQSWANTASLFFYLTCLALIFLTSLHLLYYPRNINYAVNAQGYIINGTNTFIQPPTPRKDGEKCDLFKGQWIRDAAGPLYTNYSCTTIPFLRNCFLHGRKDRDFLHWRWKPDRCDLPRFSAEKFLVTLRGRTMAFVGDSLARNHMESLLCLLSTMETPKQTQKDSEDRFMTWEFPKHNLTIMSFWSQFLVASIEHVINGTATGSFDLHLDRIDNSWSQKLHSMDYVIFSDAHWFSRQHNLYEGGKLVGCIYCQRPDVTDLGPGPAIRKAFRAAFEAINNCTNCKKVFAVLRTYSPSHFENGAWNAGGGCNRTWPVGRDEVNKDGPEWDYRRIQMEEIELARQKGEEHGNEFEILDVTEIMWTRVDGHPGLHWGNRWMKGYSDCVHWCLPGPIDVWNELLLELIMGRKDDDIIR